MFQNKPAFRRFRFPMQVWRVLPDELSRLVAVELRDPVGKKSGLSVFSMDEDGGKPEVFPANSGWWRGIEDFHEGKLVLHGYEDESLPIHLGVEVLKLPDFRPLWEDRNRVFQGFAPDGLLLRDPNSGSYELRASSSGDVVEVFPPENQSEARAKLNPLEAARQQSRLFPEKALEGEAEFLPLAERIASLSGQLPVAQIDRWSGNGVEVLHFYLPVSEGLSRHLYVRLADGTELRAVMDEQVQGLHLDPFFICDGKLISLSGRQEVWLLEIDGRRLDVRREM